MDRAHEKTCDRTREPLMPWESLEPMITATFEEAERLLACNLVNHRGKADQQPNNASLSVVTKPTSAVRAPVSAYTGVLEKCEKPRRPQHDDEYWSVSCQAWSSLSEARREILSHVGRINETSDGQQARDDCSKCADNGSECMVYRDLAGAAKSSTGGSACSRCRYRRLTCSFEAISRKATKKRKNVSHREGGPKARKTTRNGRASPGR